jgi:hypothetical protein
MCDILCFGLSSLSLQYKESKVWKTIILCVIVFYVIRFADSPFFIRSVWSWSEEPESCWYFNSWWLFSCCFFCFFSSFYEMMQGGNLQTCTTCSLSTHTHTHERARLRVCVHYNGDGLLYPGKVMTYNPMRVWRVEWRKRWSGVLASIFFPSSR